MVDAHRHVGSLGPTLEVLHREKAERRSVVELLRLGTEYTVRVKRSPKMIEQEFELKLTEAEALELHKALKKTFGWL